MKRWVWVVEPDKGDGYGFHQQAQDERWGSGQGGDGASAKHEEDGIGVPGSGFFGSGFPGMADPDAVRHCVRRK